MSIPVDPTIDQDAIGYLMHLVRAGNPNDRELALAERCAQYLKEVKATMLSFDDQLWSTYEG